MKKNLLQIIENFSDWGKPWTFYKSIMENPNINDSEKKFFSKIYSDASKYELWNYSDLTIGAKNSRKFLKNNTDLNEITINQIVNAIAYEWR